MARVAQIIIGTMFFKPFFRLVRESQLTALLSGSADMKLLYRLTYLTAAAGPLGRLAAVRFR
jgi:hypothetical protein